MVIVNVHTGQIKDADQTGAKIHTWQLGDLRSHNLIVLSSEPEINVSSTGDMQRDVTLEIKAKVKYYNPTFQTLS